MSSKILTLLKVLGIAFAFVLSAELILRFTGHLIVPSETGYDDIFHDDDEVRILALGESTTDERFAKKKAWTNQLEKQLQDKGYKVRIINVARVGSNSALLLSRLPDQLERYRPHIVITMMGINDSDSMSYHYSEPPLKLQKLFRIVRERIDSVMSCEVEKVYPHEATPENIRQWLPLSGKDNLQELERQIRLKVDSDEEVAATLAAIGAVIKNRRFPFNEADFIHLLERAYVLHPRNDHVLRFLMGVYTGRKNPRCLEIAETILPCGINLNDEFLKLITDCHTNMKKPLSMASLEIKGLSLMSGTGFTANHYQKLAGMLKSKNITLVAMQYPTLPLENLKQNFSDQTGIVFVSNEENFSEALKTYKFREIFMDNFRATWGHTTELGHGIIASSALPAVEPIVRSLSRR